MAKSWQSRGQAVAKAYQRVDRSKVGIKKICALEMGDADAAKNSLYTLMGQLSKLNLRDVCTWPSPPGAHEMSLDAKESMSKALLVA